MNPSSRRSFLGTSLALPALASVPSETGSPAQAPAAQGRAPQSAPKFTYGTLGKTGMKVTRLAFGCMITSDQSVVERAADTGINYFDTARVYQGGNNEGRPSRSTATRSISAARRRPRTGSRPWRIWIPA
jgi:hypothetical protein